jgi:hypothetical protein
VVLRTIAAIFVPTASDGRGGHLIVEAKTVIIKKGDHDKDIDRDRRSVVID